MRWAVDSVTMRSIDDRAIAMGIPSLRLMENAGAAVAQAASAVADPARQIIVLCGPGNNGGDGFVAARILRESDHGVKAVLIGSTSRLSGDSGHSLRAAQKAHVSFEEITTEAGLVALASEIAESGLVVDALLGTGSHGPPKGMVGKVVHALDSISAPILAVDVPTGVDADTGQTDGPAIHADTTVTMGLPKIGMLFHPGCALVGKLIVADIGFPHDLVAPPEYGVEILESGDLATLLPKIPSTAHKGDCGKVLVIAGSTGMTGAAALCCQGALRAGAGLVYLAIPEHLNAILETMLPETITIPVAEHDGQHCAAGFERIRERFGGVDMVVLGPGLGRGTGPAELVASVLQSWRGPMVVDADALFHLSERTILSEHVVLTPHPGEMAHLTGETVATVRANCLRSGQREAARRNAVLLLKGAPTVVADASGRCAVNLTGNAGLATGGSGDVLAGIIAGFMAQGADGYRAAQAGAFVHGLSADLAAEEMPHASIIPSDLIRLLPKALGVAGFGDRAVPAPWWKRQ